MNRRAFLGSALAAAVANTVGGAQSRGPRILLRSSWQVVNIGDIAHTPGVLALIEKHIPGAEVRLWASGDLSDEVAAMEHARFPKLQIVKGTIGADGKASNKLSIVVGADKLSFQVNGKEVHSLARSVIESGPQHSGSTGIAGIRVNHNLDVHIDGFAVTPIK